MKTFPATLFLLGVLAVAAPSADAHCDAADGPVATAALRTGGVRQ